MFEVSLKEKIAIVTGASQGIGRAIALTLAKADLKGITIVDLRKDEQGEKTEKAQCYSNDPNGRTGRSWKGSAVPCF